MQGLTIQSANGPYDVAFEPDLDALVARELADPPVAMVLDARVAELHAAALAPLRAAVPTHLVTPTEEIKSLRGVESLAEFLIGVGAHRRATLLAVGGGIVQDISSFTANAFHRGMPWRFWPTTLLAMSDSCIGAKSAINVGETKNQLGVFYAPGRVAICPAFLTTLTDAEIASGYGEILKLMLTGPEAGFATLEREVAASGLRGPALLDLVRASLDVKRGVIEVDEHETGLRQILNYGHTFGHALEAVTHHAIPHGLAVAWGIDVVNALAVKRGLLDAGVRERVRGFIRAHMPVSLPDGVTAEALLTHVRRDKKAAAGSITLAVMREPGRLERVPTPIDAALEAELAAYLAGDGV